MRDQQPAPGQGAIPGGRLAVFVVQRYGSQRMWDKARNGSQGFVRQSKKGDET